MLRKYGIHVMEVFLVLVNVNSIRRRGILSSVMSLISVYPIGMGIAFIYYFRIRKY
jgi:hypothetical protein